MKQWRSWVSPNRILRTLEPHSYCLSHSHMHYMKSHKWEARPWTKYPESQAFTLVPVWITQVLQDKPFSWQTLINSGMGPNSIFKNDLLWTYLYPVLCLLICLCWTFLSSLRGTNLFMLCDIFNVFLNSVCNHFIKDLWKLIHIVFVVITSLSGIGTWYRYQDSSLHGMSLVCGFWFYGIVWEGLLSALFFPKGGGIQHGMILSYEFPYWRNIIISIFLLITDLFKLFVCTQCKLFRSDVSLNLFISSRLSSSLNLGFPSIFPRFSCVCCNVSLFISLNWSSLSFG